MGAHAEIEAGDAGDYNELGKQKDILPMGCDALHRLASAFYETDLPLGLFVGMVSAYRGRRASKSASSSSEEDEKKGPGLVFAFSRNLVQTHFVRVDLKHTRTDLHRPSRGSKNG